MLELTKEETWLNNNGQHVVLLKLTDYLNKRIILLFFLLFLYYT